MGPPCPTLMNFCCEIRLNSPCVFLHGQTNRVLRKYESGNFIRVSIRDENFDKVSTLRGEVTNLLDRVGKVMREGFRVGCTTFYSYLASSNSQIREHACWFVEAQSTASASDIREWIGELSGEWTFVSMKHFLLLVILEIVILA